MKASRVKFNANALRSQLTKQLVAQQTQLLVDYAKAKIVEIGNTIRTWHSAHHMDRTGHLLDSLCWGVAYNGQLQEGGFYRQASAHGNSYLHEWFSGDVKYLIPVNGHELAQRYLETYGNNGGQGWKVFFAILAPYWGYWEKGFKMKSHFGNGKSGVTATYQFAVMTHFYDQIRTELKPARTRFRVSVAKYDKPKLEKKWAKYAG